MIKKTGFSSFMHLFKEMIACVVCANTIVGAEMEQGVSSLPSRNLPSPHGMGGRRKQMESRCADVVF